MRWFRKRRINTDPGMPPEDINHAVRAIMADLRLHGLLESPRHHFWLGADG